MLTALNTVLKAFFDICLLRKRPQDLPKSTVLLISCFVMYTVIGMLLTMQSGTFIVVLMVSLVDAGFLLTATFLVLRQHRHIDRWHQTMTALFGTGAILGIFSPPAGFCYSSNFWAQSQHEGWLQPITVLFFLAMVIWSIVIFAHIIRHAISTSMGIGVVIAILYTYCTNSLFIAMLLAEISVQ